jgi:hypothetical protein
MTAADSHWQLGRVESHGHVVKKMLDRMNTEVPIKDNADFSRALRQIFNAKNTMSRIKGYTPEQAVLGFARRLPASIISGESASSHVLATAEGHESDKFRKTLDLRCSARKAFVEADNSSSLRRALLRRSRPLRDPYEVGDWVLYWRKVGGNMRRERKVAWTCTSSCCRKFQSNLADTCKSFDQGKPRTIASGVFQGMEGCAKH